MKKQNKKSVKETKIDPERKMAFESLPPNIKNGLTEDEKELFLYAEEWPDTLADKLSEFLSPVK